MEEFLLSVQRRKKRPATQRFYREQLEPFSRWMKERNLADLDALSRPALKAYLEGLAVSPGSARARHRAVRALYRWSRSQEPPLCAKDPTAGLKIELPEEAHAVEIFTPEECAAMLSAAGEHAPAVALMLYAGVRPEELGGFGKPRLQWEHVDRGARLIRVPSEVAKNGKARIIEGLPSTLWRWMPLARERRWGAALPIDWPTLRDRLKAAVGKWKHDGLRHSFATYMLAVTQDPGKVALWLGHEGAPTLLYRHYRGLATKKQAREFLALRP